MSSANKARGTKFETDIVDYLNSRGKAARRLARTGAKDTGDAEWAIPNFGSIVIEAKNRRAMALPEWIAESEVEAVNFTEKYKVPAIPIVVSKRRGKGAHAAYVVMQLDTFVELVEELTQGKDVL